MPIDTDHLINALATIADQESMKVAVKQSAKGAAVCGSACFVGGLLGGPLGLAVGGTLGGVLAHALTKDAFKSVSYIIKHDLTIAQKEKFREHLELAFRHMNVVDVIQLSTMILSTSSMRRIAIQAIQQFLIQNLNFEMVP